MFNMKNIQDKLSKGLDQVGKAAVNQVDKMADRSLVKMDSAAKKKEYAHNPINQLAQINRRATDATGAIMDSIAGAASAEHLQGKVNLATAKSLAKTQIKREERNRKEHAAFEYKRLTAALVPTGQGKGLFMPIRWDDRLRIMDFHHGKLLKYDTLQAIEIRQRVQDVTYTTGSSKKKHALTRGIVGDLLLGPVGALAGVATAHGRNHATTTTSQQVTYFILITRNDPIQAPSSFLVPYDERAWNKLQSILTELRSKQQSQTPSQTVTAPAARQPLQDIGIADELLKLKKLLDAGAISKDEFDEQKKKLLNQ